MVVANQFEEQSESQTAPFEQDRIPISDSYLAWLVKTAFCGLFARWMQPNLPTVLAGSELATLR